MKCGSFKKLAFTFCAMLALTSCGDSPSGGSGEFNTVYTSTAISSAVTHSDLSTTAPDSITLSVTSNPYPSTNTNTGGSGVQASALEITDVTVALTPADTTRPALPALYQSVAHPMSVTVVPGATLPITVEVATSALKAFLPTVLAAGSSNRYYVQFSIRASELKGKTATFTAQSEIIFDNP